MVSCLAQKSPSSHNGVRGPLWPAGALPWLCAPSTKFHTSPPTTLPSPLCYSHCFPGFSGNMSSMFLPPGTLHVCLRTLFCQVSTWVALKVSVQMWGCVLYKIAPHLPPQCSLSHWSPLQHLQHLSLSVMLYIYLPIVSPRLETLQGQRLDFVYCDISSSWNSD